MQIVLWCLIGLLITFSANAQHGSVDRAPDGAKNSRAVEGGSRAVKIDTKHSLDELITRLNEGWVFVETGKAYWIGYTDDMYAIAARKEDAIQPLMDFIGGPSNEHGKQGAIYCLHLIGIRSTIAGRFYEEFTSLKAREALLKLLEQPALQATVMSLLIRDPWQSDVPVLFAALSKSSAKCWTVINGLIRYTISDLPIHQQIPQALDKIPLKASAIKYNASAPFAQAYESQFISLLKSIEAMHNEAIFIDSTLFHAKLWGEWMTDFGDASSIRESTNKLTLGIFLRNVTAVDYDKLGSRVQYYTENSQQLFICSPQTVKQKLISWWSTQPPEVKARFREHAAKHR